MLRKFVYSVCIGSFVMCSLPLYATCSLLERFPELQKKVPYVQLGILPTPVQYCAKLSKKYPGAQVYSKHDGLSGKLRTNTRRVFAGNKLRKLSFLLADARAQGHDTVLTFGSAGSNHALQTAIYAKQLGLDCICILKPQPNTPGVQRNLLLQQRYGAQLKYAADTEAQEVMAQEICADYARMGRKEPYVIPLGGSCACGVLGYVDAVLELKDQVDAGVLPLPDCIYVAAGSGGTAAGILLGLQVAQIACPVKIVLVEPDQQELMRAIIQKLFQQAAALLHELDTSCAYFQLNKSDIILIDTFTGAGYGVLTPEALAARDFLRATENIILDDTYTAKAFAALLYDLPMLVPANVLFWHTFSADVMEDVAVCGDFMQLPEALHQYFAYEVC